MNYLFIANSSVPSKTEYYSTSPITLSNYYIPCIEAALSKKANVFVGVNRKFTEQIRCENYPQVKFYNAQIYRNPFALLQVYRAYRNLIAFIRNNKISVIHCNTPIGGLLGRVCGKKEKVNKVIYTVHGFHFLNGGNKYFNKIFYAIEKYLLNKTDTIITINKEDYNAALKMSQDNPHTRVFKVHGVGISTKKFASFRDNTKELRYSLEISNTDFVIITVGDINKNKNQEVVIRAVNHLKNPNIHFLICGKGKHESKLKKLSKQLKIESQIHFLGYRTDIPALLNCADAFVLSSLREGLPRSTMEAMAVGLPCIVSKVRGNIDLIDDKQGGYTCNPIKYIEFANAINNLFTNRNLKDIYGTYNKRKIKEYDIDVVKKEIDSIYSMIL